MRPDQPAPDQSASGASPLEQSWDDTDRGWGEIESDPEDSRLSDERLIRDKPPHYEE